MRLNRYFIHTHGKPIIASARNKSEVESWLKRHNIVATGIKRDNRHQHADFIIGEHKAERQDMKGGRYERRFTYFD